ncbi:MAG: DUF4097 family beta strand repeat-containing protein [Candidatus Hydrogenedentes bacterium]|nr:DUF4097 family beta strand repeat-containing protein [Candidatus Hydrogenedentota bacterium]
MKKVLIRGLLALAVIATAHASTTIVERRPFGADGEVEIEVTSGSVTVEAWNEPEIKVTGTIGGNADHFQFELEDDEALIRVRNPKSGQSGGSGNIVVRVPHLCKEIRVKVTSADVVIHGVEGDVRVGSVSGDVRIYDMKGNVRAETVSGDLVVDGDIADCEVKAVSGDVSVKTVRGDVRGNTISGELTIEGNVINELKCESISGNVSYTGSVDTDADIEVKAHSGNVTLALPANVSADIYVNCFSGNIKNGLSDERPRQPRGPGSTLDMTLNSGSANIEAEAFSGNVTLKTL